MAIQGQRFQLNLDECSSDKLTSGLNIDLVGDIKERIASSDPRPPSPPRFRNSQTGFPAHKDRINSSRLKKRTEAPSQDPKRFNGSKTKHSAQGQSDSSMRAVPDENRLRSGIEYKDPSIDHENKRRLAEMSDKDIEDARQEIMTGLNPSLIEKLLKRANIDDRPANSAIDTQPAEDIPREQVNKTDKKVIFDHAASSDSVATDKPENSVTWDPDGPPLHLPPDLHPASSYPSSLPQPPNIHFPNPPQAPDLDPSDPDFLSSLRSNYFPNLPDDPSTLAWMTPLSPQAEEESSYSLSQESHPISALRFDFRGHLLPPRLSAQIPSTKGLHHHAHAPTSAGYTVPELSHLARSTYPAQRCIAYQTLGRILYRLGRGDFGREGEDLCEGLWQSMEEGKVIDQLVEAAAKGDSSNRTVWVVATEAVWLWRKGGGRRWRGR